MSEQRNPRHQSALAADNGQSDSEPFSIREYALASRQRDVIRSWPFQEKYLGIFRSRGIDAHSALPPFEPHHSALRSLRGRPVRFDGSEAIKETLAGSGQSSTSQRENVSKPECNLSKSDEATSEICSQDCVNAQSCNGVVSSAKTMMVKRKWPGRKCKKKKSIVKILGVTEPCSSQNTFLESRVEESKKTSNGEQNCDSELSEDDQSFKTKPKVADTHMSDTKKTVFSVFKYRLRNYSSRRSRSSSKRGRGKKV